MVAVIVDNREYIGRTAINRHSKFLDCEIVWINDYFGDYNKLLTTVDFWKPYEGDHVLIFQHDSGLLKPIPDWCYAYDYIGAPWRFQEHGGNGGLSFRRPKVMIDILKRHTWHSMAANGNEDVWYCNIMKSEGYNIAPRDVCSKFSVESIFQLGTVGWHAIDKWLTPDECQQIRNQYK